MQDYTTTELEGGGMLRYWPEFLSASTSKELYEELTKNCVFFQSEIRVYGKVCKTPRLQCWMANKNIKASVYSKDAPIPWCDSMLSLKTQLENLLGVTFDYCLLNLYRTGQDYISHHSDNEATDGKDTIASISLGATRRFLFRNKSTNYTYEFSLIDGSLIVMSGEEAQINWKHSVPKTTKVTTPRLNLTFRKS